MGRTTKRVSVAVSLLILAVLACQPGPAPAPTYIVTIQPIQTATLPFQTAPPVITAPTLVEVGLGYTATPTFTPEATATPTDTLIPTPTVPLVSVSAATNCRTGPGRVYDRVMVVDVGITYEIIGKDTPDNYWIIKLPNGGLCWLWGQYALVAGNVNNLPEFVPPPSPTPLPLVGSISGVITDRSKNPLGNATVTIQLAKRTYTTSSDGKYSFDNLPPGAEFITVSVPSYSSSFRSVNVNMGNTATVDFRLDNFSYYVGPASVEGLVLLNSAPVPGATVMIWSSIGGFAATVTDGNGRYRFDTRAGHHLIVAELGNLRGGVEVILDKELTTAPDIFLFAR